MSKFEGPIANVSDTVTYEVGKNDNVTERIANLRMDSVVVQADQLDKKNSAGIAKLFHKYNLWAGISEGKFGEIDSLSKLLFPIDILYYFSPLWRQGYIKPILNLQIDGNVIDEYSANCLASILETSKWLSKP